MSISILRFARDVPTRQHQRLSLILESKTIEMQDIIYRISENEDKLKLINEALSKAYFIRMALRLYLDLGIMKTETNIFLNTKIEEVLKQLSGWRKSLA